MKNKINIVLFMLVSSCTSVNKELPKSESSKKVDKSMNEIITTLNNSKMTFSKNLESSLRKNEIFNQMVKKVSFIELGEEAKKSC